MNTNFQLFETLSDPIVVLSKTGEQVVFQNQTALTINLPYVDLVSNDLVSTESGRSFTIHKKSNKDHIFLHLKEISELVKFERKFTDFVYIASHDLREPARKIVTFGERLRTVIDDKEDPKALAYLERMEASSLRLQKMLDDLLFFSRIKKIEHKPINISELIKVAASSKSLNIELNDVTQIYVNGSKEQLNEVFEQIFDNCQKFRSNDSLAVQVALRIEEDLISIEINDNGIGIDPNEFENAFKPFVRLNGRSAYAGSGMGLAIVRKIIENHNGTICFSAVDKGTKLLISLPAIK